MIYLQLFWEFLKIGLFAVGGGMATLPFLQDLAESTGWYSQALITDMIAISESTPGPIGINMATYVGYTVGGIPGAVIATVGEITPSIIVILLVAMLLKSFKDNRYVNMAFYGLRPASTGLIGAACITVIFTVLLRIGTTGSGLLNVFSVNGAVNVKGLLLAAVLLVLTNNVKKVKDLHPVMFIAGSAVVGVIFRFAGV